MPSRAMSAYVTQFGPDESPYFSIDGQLGSGNAQNPDEHVPFGAHCAFSLQVNEPPP